MDCLLKFTTYNLQDSHVFYLISSCSMPVSSFPMSMSISSFYHNLLQVFLLVDGLPIEIYNYLGTFGHLLTETGGMSQPSTVFQFDGKPIRLLIRPVKKSLRRIKKLIFSLDIEKLWQNFRGIIYWQFSQRNLQSITSVG